MIINYGITEFKSPEWKLVSEYKPPSLKHWFGKTVYLIETDYVRVGPFDTKQEACNLASMGGIQLEG